MSAKKNGRALAQRDLGTIFEEAKQLPHAYDTTPAAASQEKFFREVAACA